MMCAKRYLIITGKSSCQFVDQLIVGQCVGDCGCVER